MDNKIGSWAFIVGLVIAVVLGLSLTEEYKLILTWTLFGLGVLVGILNITSEETQSFLTAGTIMALLAYIGIQVNIFSETVIIINILRGILTLFIPSTIIVALKAVYELAYE